MSKVNTFLIIFFVLGIVVVVWFLSPNFHRQELKNAYEKTRQFIREAQLTGDTSKLSQVLTQNMLTDVETAIKKQSSEIIIRGPESNIDWIWVSEYNPPEAIITVTRSTSRIYVYNRETKKMIFEDRSSSRSYSVKVKMYQEDGVWKLHEVIDLVGVGP